MQVVYFLVIDFLAIDKLWIELKIYVLGGSLIFLFSICIGVALDFSLPYVMDRL
jgi:hypothetical protein